jgi:hypothetical protein
MNDGGHDRASLGAVLANDKIYAFVIGQWEHRSLLQPGQCESRDL